MDGTSSDSKQVATEKPEGVYFMLFISIKEAFPKQGRFYLNR
jgi:hypothetical protein